jgi:hypothetical protein
MKGFILVSWWQLPLSETQTFKRAECQGRPGKTETSPRSAGWAIYSSSRRKGLVLEP